MTAQLAQINIATNAVSAINPASPQPKTLEDLNAELTVLEAELAKVSAKAGSLDAYSHRVQHATSGHLLGTVALSDLQAAQADYDDAVAAIARRSTLQRAVAEARRSVEYAQSQERRQFIDGIHSQFQQVRERYVIASKSLLELFREMHRLHMQSQGMHSRELLTAKDYALDLPAIRREADSELFSIGQMLRDGSY